MKSVVPDHLHSGLEAETPVRRPHEERHNHSVRFFILT